MNDTPNWNQATCTSKDTDTFSWGGSVTVGVEAKAWIFAQVSADVSANFQKTRTTERSTSPSFKLPPRSKRYCFDGVDFERYKVRRCTLSSYDPGNNHCRVTLPGAGYPDLAHHHEERPFRQRLTVLSTDRVLNGSGPARAANP